MAEKKKSLGKGLANIYGDDVYNIIEELENSGLANHIEIDKIRVNPYQPRKNFDANSLQELAESIATHGLITPILVREAVSGYELIAGERRVRAAKIAGLQSVPAIIAEFDDKQMMEISLLENIQREDLNAIEEASGYNRLIESMNYTQEMLAQRVNKSRSHIANMLRLLKLPKSVQNLVAQGKLDMGHVRPLITIGDRKEIEVLAKRIVADGLSVRQVETLIKGLGKQSSLDSKKNKDYCYAEELLMKKLQTSVTVDGRKIVIKYRGDSDLNRILELLDCLED